MKDIKRIRYALGYSQTELANRLGICLSTMCKYERTGVHSSKIDDRLEEILKEEKLYHFLDENEIDIKSAIKQLLVSVEEMKYTIEMMKKEMFG